jgi:histidinol-phosphate aminotransferase
MGAKAERPRLSVDVRPCVARMEAYHGPLDDEQLAEELGIPLSEIVKLDANENPYGPTPRLRVALAAFDRYQLYPDAEQRSLRRWIGSYVGIDPELVMAGNGADEMIDLLMRAFLDPGDELMDFPPSFGMYAFNAQHYDARVVVVERDARFDIDPARAAAAVTPRTKILMVTSPNNPTGNTVPPATIRALLETGRVVVVDEAYVEFSSGSFASWVPKYENLVVLRTFSKWAGLAGLRIGYALVPAGIARQLWKLKPPFSVNQAAVVAVRESLLDQERLLENCQKIVAERERLLGRLVEVPYLRPYPSQANFILCDVVGRDALELQLALRRRGILIRHYGSARLQNSIRISVGTPAQDDVLLAALEQL